MLIPKCTMTFVVFLRNTNVRLPPLKKIKIKWKAFTHQMLCIDFPREFKTERHWDLSGCQVIIFHFIIPSVVGSVCVSVDCLRYITGQHALSPAGKSGLDGGDQWGSSRFRAWRDAIIDRHLRPQLVITGRVITAHVTSQCVTTLVCGSPPHHPLWPLVISQWKWLEHV